MPGLDAPHSLRFIPACAGNAHAMSTPHLSAIGSSPRVRGTRPRTTSASRRSTVHPRVCGERLSRRAVQNTNGGSSPRVRGTHLRAVRSRCGQRFIPACAGNAIKPERTTTPCRFIPACAGNARGKRGAVRCAAVHPRVCGERTRSKGQTDPHNGSSPRVRGTPRIVGERHGLRRFIPACAGNAGTVSAEELRQQVHPRVCGERPLPGCPIRRAAGSSPRVRGTLHVQDVRPILRRFIPACAGNARRPLIRCTPCPVHPRVCGERARAVRDSLASRGSSPRVRGTPAQPRLHRRRHRFIPACAGNAIVECVVKAAMLVHPRVCGERGRGVGWGDAPVGSSPRVRGTRAWPATLRPCAAVHPRVCGERGLDGARGDWVSGSSPRVRGTLIQHGQFDGPDRFIPACAGNACRRARRCRGTSVHPRVCGERAGRNTANAMSIGSSPRVRGTRRDGAGRHRAGGFIPACAGNAGGGGVGGTGVAVHPRVCGERASRRQRPAPHPRFIPACAGNAPRRSA